MWPNFFVVGAANSGTTSLYSILRQHPQVFLPALKEPHYFAQTRPAYEQRYMRSHINDQSAYLKLFRQATGYKAVGEASPSYLWEARAAHRIRQAVPGAKIIILLRDPIERAYSHYLMDAREGLQRLRLYEALRQDWNRPDKGWSVSHLYIELGLYAEQVRRYLQVFSPGQVRIVLFDDLMKSAENGKAVIADIFEFLGLDLAPLGGIDASRAENSFAVARWPWATRLAGTNWARRAGQLLVPPSLGANHTVKRVIFQRYFLKPAPKPPMDPRVKDWLRSIYDPDVRALEDLLGRELPELRRSW